MVASPYSAPWGGPAARQDLSTVRIICTTGAVATYPQRLGPVRALGRDEVDCANLCAWAAAIRAHGPSAELNAAACSAVDWAEATTINGVTPYAMPEDWAALYIFLTRISTD